MRVFVSNPTVLTSGTAMIGVVSPEAFSFVIDDTYHNLSAGNQPTRSLLSFVFAKEISTWMARSLLTMNMKISLVLPYYNLKFHIYTDWPIAILLVRKLCSIFTEQRGK